jgi:hypothetical protein
MSSKSEIFIEASMYALNGLTGNPVNQGLSASALVAKALNLGAVFAAQVEQALGAANMTPKIQQAFTLAAIPTDPTITLTVNAGDPINVVNQSTTTTTIPTTVSDPGGGFIASRSSGSAGAL